MNMADCLVSRLQDMGINTLFGLCGNGLDPILDAAHRHGMRIIDVRNEQAAAYMADAVGRYTGGIGVAVASSGIAHINALAGVCNAWFDGSPMLLITGASDSAYHGRGNFQDMETADLAKPLCKYSKYVGSRDRLLPMLDEAVAFATAGRPGPVHLTIPTDVLLAGANEGAAAATAPSSKVRYNQPVGDDFIKDAVHLIASAARPVIIAGSGVFYADASDELSKLAECIMAPIIVPIWDRGAVEGGCKFYCGVIGAASGGPDILSDADLVILAGVDVDYRIGYLEKPSASTGVRTIRIEVDPTAMHSGISPDVALLGDTKNAMSQLVSGLDGLKPTEAWLTEALDRKDTFYTAMKERWGPQRAAQGDLPGGDQIITALRDIFSAEVNVLVDGGNIGQWFHMIMNDRYSLRWLTCGRSAVVGWGFPAAAAISSLDTNGRTLLLSGDGASTFTIAEIENAVRQKLPYVAVIADDSAWGIVVSGSTKRGVPPVASQLGQIKFDEVAKGFGARGIRVDDISTLAEEVEAGFRSGTVTVLHVPMVSGGPADF